MSYQFITNLRFLFEINASRQAEMDTLFLSMPNYPSTDQLTLLHDTVEHSVPEAQVLLSSIDSLLESPEQKIPGSLMGKIMLQKSLLEQQIKYDRGLIAYLEKEYAFLSPALKFQ